MNNSTQKLKESYFKLKTKLINPGLEVSFREVMWNDGIYDEIDTLFANVKPELITRIKNDNI